MLHRLGRFVFADIVLILSRDDEMFFSGLPSSLWHLALPLPFNISDIRGTLG